MSITGGTWTYSGNPAASSLDAVRAVIGDTDTSDQLLSDEEILWALSSQGNVFSAGSLCCHMIIGSGRLNDKRVGDLIIWKSQRASQLKQLAAELTRQVAIGAIPYAGGISIADKRSVSGNTDRPYPFGEIGIHDNPYNPQQTASTSST